MNGGGFPPHLSPLFVWGGVLPTHRPIHLPAPIRAQNQRMKGAIPPPFPLILRTAGLCQTSTVELKVLIWRETACHVTLNPQPPSSITTAPSLHAPKT